MSLLYMAGAPEAPTPGRRGPSRLTARLAISLFVGLFLYCALSLLVGPAGIAAYRNLEERKVAMVANLAGLAVIRQSLNTELESLKNDPDRAVREARSLGYLRKGETAIILGPKTEGLRSFGIGKVLPYAEPSALGDAQLKKISFGAFLATLAILLAPRRPISAGGGARGAFGSVGPVAVIGTAWSKRRRERSYYPKKRRQFRSR